MHGKSDIQLHKISAHLYPDIYFPQGQAHLIVFLLNTNVIDWYRKIRIRTTI